MVSDDKDATATTAQMINTMRQILAPLQQMKEYEKKIATNERIEWKKRKPVRIWRNLNVRDSHKIWNKNAVWGYVS